MEQVEKNGQNPTTVFNLLRTSCSKSPVSVRVEYPDDGAIVEQLPVELFSV
jgi:hypothetical protein